MRLLLALHATAHVYAALQIDEVMEIMRGVRGGCTPRDIETLKKMWPQMQEATWIASELTAKHAFVSPNSPPVLDDELRESFAVDVRGALTIKDRSINYARKTTVNSGLKVAFDELTTDPDQPESPGSKKQLYCGSSALIHYGPDSLIYERSPGEHGPGTEIHGKPLKDRVGYDPNLEYWLLPTLRGGAALVTEPAKDVHPKRRKFDLQSFCGDPTRYVWTIPGNQWLSIPRSKNVRNDVIILCPRFFEQLREGEDSASSF